MIAERLRKSQELIDMGYKSYCDEIDSGFTVSFNDQYDKYALGWAIRNERWNSARVLLQRFGCPPDLDVKQALCYFELLG